MSTHWFVAMAQPNMDARVARDLIEQGFDAYISLTFKRQRHGNGYFTEAESWLSPYVFVGLGDGQGLKAVHETLGVIEILCLSVDDRGLRATEVDAEIIAGLRAAEIADLDAATRRVRRRDGLYKIGEEIVVADHGHLLRGETGKIRAMRPGFLSVEFKRGQFPWTIKEGDVMPMHPFEGRASEDVAAA